MRCEVVVATKGKEHSNGFKLSYGSKCFFVINPLFLVIPLSNQPSFVFYDISRLIKLVLEDLFSSWWS